MKSKTLAIAITLLVSAQFYAGVWTSVSMVLSEKWAASGFVSLVTLGLCALVCVGLDELGL